MQHPLTWKKKGLFPHIEHRKQEVGDSDQGRDLSDLTMSDVTQSPGDCEKKGKSVLTLALQITGCDDKQNLVKISTLASAIEQDQSTVIYYWLILCPGSLSLRKLETSLTSSIHEAQRDMSLT